MSGINIEDRMEPPELRRELRAAWDQHYALMDALHELPDVPSPQVLRALADYRGGFPDLWNIGKEEQRRQPWGTVPAKTEYEIAQGLWAIIRDALRAYRDSADETAQTGSGEGDSAVAKPIAENPPNTPPEPLTERWD